MMEAKANATAPISYLFSECISAEVLLGLPFEHSILTKTGDKVDKAQDVFHQRLWFNIMEIPSASLSHMLELDLTTHSFFQSKQLAL